MEHLQQHVSRLPGNRAVEEIGRREAAGCSKLALVSPVRPCVKCSRVKRNFFHEENHLDTSTSALPLLCPSWLWDGSVMA